MFPKRVELLSLVLMNCVRDRTNECLSPQVPSACSLSAICTGAAPAPAALAAWPRSVVIPDLQAPVALTFACSLGELEGRGWWGP